MSLKVSRTLGDGANKFTLQLFDETAWKLESLLYGTGQAPISFRYGAPEEWKKEDMLHFLEYALIIV